MCKMFRVEHFCGGGHESGKSLELFHVKHFCLRCLVELQGKALTNKIVSRGTKSIGLQLSCTH
jgi:hypothetical protein